MLQILIEAEDPLPKILPDQDLPPHILDLEIKFQHLHDGQVGHGPPVVEAAALERGDGHSEMIKRISALKIRQISVRS